jgi:hypothetical protein
MVLKLELLRGQIQYLRFSLVTFDLTPHALLYLTAFALIVLKLWYFIPAKIQPLKLFNICWKD